MGQRIEVADIVALDLKPGAIIRTGRQDVFDVGERILEDPVSRAFQVWVVPNRV